MEFKYLKKTPLYKAFSELGKRIFVPEGIFYYSNRAKKEAEINGTIGTAYGFEKDFIDGGSNEWIPCYLDGIKNYIGNAHVKDFVPYAPIGGVQDTRELWKEWIIKKSLFDENTSKEQVARLRKYITLPIITSGVTNGIYIACALFLNPNEYIIAPNRRWENYDTIIEKYLGARIKSFEFFKENKINLKALKEVIEEVAQLQNKIVIILNFPNNPTGYIPTVEEVNDIVTLLKEMYYVTKKPMIIIVDDAYEPYVYEENVLDKSLFYDLHNLDEDIIPIKLDGITKELLLYGARIGFFTIGLKPNWIKNDSELDGLKSEILNKLEGMNRSIISNCNMFFQNVTLKIFKEQGIDKIIAARNKVKEILKLRYKKINSEFNKIENPDISVDPNSGGFFIFVNLNPNKINATEFADHLLKKYKVGIIPFQNLEDKVNGIRIAYCSIDIKQIPEFVSRINQALNDFS